MRLPSGQSLRTVDLPCILYVSYDGMLEPLGRSQVVSYVKKLAIGRTFYLLTFEKSSDLRENKKSEALKHELESFGINWIPVRYHKRFSLFATSWDILIGFGVALIIAMRCKLSVVHARGYVPSVIALILTKLTGAAYLFDMRGFWADEKLDGGWEQTDLKYRLAKYFEKKFLLHADHVVTLTNAAVPVIRSFPYLEGRVPPITVIPTCADLERFTVSSNSTKRSVFTVGYVGTATNWYLFDHVAACFAEMSVIKPEVRFLIVNRNEHDFIRNKLVSAGVSLDSVELVAADYEQMPDLIARMHASIYFIKPVFSKRGSAATKLAEFLGCGVPCLTNAGVGDIDEIFSGEGSGKGIGVLLRSFERTSLVSGVNKLIELVDDPQTAERCAAVAKKYFSLEDGVKRYIDIYESFNIFHA